MANLYFYQQATMANPSVWYGNVSSYSSSHISLSSYPYSATYYGSFTFSSAGLSGGTVTGYSQWYNGNLSYEANGANVSAVTLNNYLNIGNGEAVQSFVLSGNDNINGSTYSDFIKGYAGNDIIYGNQGDDTINGGAGADAMYGGSGNDTFYVDNVGDVVIENPSEGTDQIYAAASYSLSTNLENLTLTGSGSTNGTGNAFSNIILGNIAANRLDGSGNTDTLIGGTGNDTYVVDNAGDDIQEASTVPTEIDTVEASLSWALGGNLENLTLTGSGNFDATGNVANNLLKGNSGNNRLDGAFGADTMLGMGGNDTYVVNSADDKVYETTLTAGTVDAGGTDTVEASVSFTLSNFVESLTLTGSDNIKATGNTLGNIITGNDGNNILDGKAGADTMDGREGSDIYVIGLAGDHMNNETISDSGTGFSDIDEIRFAATVASTLILSSDIDGIERVVIGTGAAASAVTTVGVALNVNASAAGQVLDITGNAGANIITGTAYGDSIDGGAGADMLDGGVGTDTLIGGTGGDIYIVDDAGDVVQEASNLATESDTVQSSISYSLTDTTNGNQLQYVEKLELKDLGNINGTGNALANTILGNDGNNELDGLGGVDTLKGGKGDDKYIVDLIKVGTGATASAKLQDTVTELAVQGIDTLKLRASIDLTNATTLILGANLEHLDASDTGSTKLNLTGTTAANTLTGNSTNNILNGLAGADILIGGAGNDTYIIDIAGDTITEALNEGTDLVNVGIATPKQTYTLGANLENAALINSVAFSLTGNVLDNALTGNAAINTLNGGEGNDTLDGKAGVDTLIGGAGNDTYVIDNVGDLVSELGTDASDWIKASIAIDLSQTKYLGIENLELTGAAAINATGDEGNNQLIGNSAANILDGKAGADTMAGGKGNDTYIVDNIGDAVSETFLATQGGGIDTIKSHITHTLGANVENLTLMGADAINGLGNDLANILVGNSGNNTLDGKAGADQLIGGDGDDIFIVDNPGDKVSETNALPGSGDDEVRSSITYKLGVNLENLTLTGVANINANGNALDNIVRGNSGNNIIDGGSGMDWMIGGEGDDVYFVDTVDHNYEIIDVVDEEFGAGIDTVMVTAKLRKGEGSSFQLSANVENGILTEVTHVACLYGNALDNTLTGNAAGNVLNGWDGADTMNGGAGNDLYYVDNAGDFIIDSAGNDTVVAFLSYSLADKVNLENITLSSSQGQVNGTGNALANILDSESDCVSLLAGRGGDDIYIVNAGDGVVEALNEGIDLVKSQVSFTLGDNVEHLMLTDSDPINGTGNDLANTLTGNNGNNTLDGKAGADKLIGGGGDDTYVVNLKSIGIGAAMIVALEDTITETALLGSGIDTVQLSGTFILTKATTLMPGINLENMDASGAIDTKLNLSGTAAANVLTGNNLDNILNGLAGSDQLIGGAGADLLNGGIGNDTLTGSADNDIFRFDSALNKLTNIDAITDFTTGEDKIQLENAIFAKLKVGALLAENFAGATALDANDFILYDTNTGALSYDADGSGKGAAVQFAILTGMPTLTVADFVIS